jgi:hypothetical protein
MKKINKLSRKGEIASNEVILIIIGILVIASVVMFMYKNDLLKQIRNIIGYESPEDTETDLTMASDAVLKSMRCPYKVAAIYSKDTGVVRSFIKMYNGKDVFETPVYFGWFGDRYDNTLFLDYTGGVFGKDPEVGKIVNKRIRLNDNFISGNGYESYKKNLESNYPGFNYKKLLELDGAFYLGGNLICSEVNFSKLAMNVQVGGLCERRVQCVSRNCVPEPIEYLTSSEKRIRHCQPVGKYSSASGALMQEEAGKDENKNTDDKCQSGKVFLAEANFGSFALLCCPTLDSSCSDLNNWGYTISHFIMSKTFCDNQGIICGFDVKCQYKEGMGCADKLDKGEVKSASECKSNKIYTLDNGKIICCPAGFPGISCEELPNFAKDYGINLCKDDIDNICRYSDLCSWDSNQNICKQIIYPGE